jgi:hypothetical protein
LDAFLVDAKRRTPADASTAREDLDELSALIARLQQSDLVSLADRAHLLGMQSFRIDVRNEVFAIARPIAYPASFVTVAFNGVVIPPIDRVQFAL